MVPEWAEKPGVTFYSLEDLTRMKKQADESRRLWNKTMLPTLAWLSVLAKKKARCEGCEISLLEKDRQLRGNMLSTRKMDPWVPGTSAILRPADPKTVALGASMAISGLQDLVRWERKELCPSPNSLEREQQEQRCNKNGRQRRFLSSKEDPHCSN